MDLKNAVAVCLISLFSATLVVLIARTLDSQAAARLEPQLAKIVEELQALRKGGGIAAVPTSAAASDAASDGLIVYYFHSNTRCPTCQAIEAQSKEAVHTSFASRLQSGEMVWKVLNYDQSSNKALAAKFDVQMPVVVLARMKAGQLQHWKRLDEVWPLVGDKPAFAKFIREQVEQMLTGGTPAPAAKPTSTAASPPNVPLPVLPIPSAPPKIPVPK